MQHSTKAEAVYVELKEMILTGILHPGAPLNQEKIAAELGVSTTPVREALRRLQTQGWVTVVAHGDLAVTEIRAGEMAEVYHAKAILECEAARLAALHHTIDDDDAMRAALAATDNRSAAHRDRWRSLRDIHQSVYRASHHQVLIEMLDRLWDQYERHQLVLSELVESRPVQDEHIEIVQAVLDGDADRAVVTLRRHLDHAARKAETDGRFTNVATARI